MAIKSSTTDVDPTVEKVTYNRTKDANTATGKWLKEIMDKRPWFADMLPNVGI